MEFNVTAGAVMDSVRGINILLEARKANGQGPRAAIGMAIRAVARAIQPHVDDFNTELNLLRGRIGNMPPETRERAFQREFLELRAVTVTLTGIGKISLKALETEGVYLPVQEMNDLEWLLVFDVEPEFVSDPAPPPKSEVPPESEKTN